MQSIFQVFPIKVIQVILRNIEATNISYCTSFIKKYGCRLCICEDGVISAVQTELHMSTHHTVCTVN